MYNKNLLKNLQDSVYVVEENGKKVNNDNFNRIIAPIYQQSITPILQKKKQKEPTWFQSGAFSDGYDFGDVTKTLLGTGIDATVNYTKGILGVPEGMLDFGTNVLASGLDLVGADKAANDLKNFAQRNLVDELGNIVSIDSLNEFVDNNSLLGDKSDNIVQGVGQLTGQMAGQAIGIPWQVTAFTSSAGQEMNNAFANNATAGEAFTSGFISGSVEVLTEYLGGGADKLLGISSLGGKAIERLGSKISNKLAQRLIKFGLDAGSEGLEEVLSGYGTAFGQKLTYMSDKEIKELYSSEQALDDFIGGVLVTGIANIPGNIRSIKRGENAFTGYTQNEEKVLNALTQEQVQEKQNQTNKIVSQKEIDKIRENIEKQMKDGNLDSNKINDIIGENVTNKDVFLQKNLTNNIQNTSNLPINLTVEQQNNNGNEKYSNDSKLPNMLKYEATGNEKINSFRKSLINENVIDNEKTRNEMNVIEKVIADKDYNVVFDSSITNKNGDIVDGKISINENGETDIRLNPNSDRAVEFLLVHEITHAIENNELRGLVLDYASQNKEFSNVLKDLQNTYNTTEVSDEVLADISGQILGNQEFIKSLSTQNTVQSKNTIRKIYESIRRLLNKITTNGRYKNFVQDLETKWREAYSIATNETAINNLYDLDKFTEKKGAALDKSSLSITTGRPVSSSSSGNNIPQSNQNVKSGISTKYSMQSRENNTQELDNSSFSLKEKQLEIIKKENPMLDDYHTGIRTIDDIKTPEEAFKTKIDEDEDYSYPDFTQEDGEKALESGKITVYSSKEIKQGTFVSPSKSMVQDYAGDGKIFEQTISINDVAWINSDEGQYAKIVSNDNNTINEPKLSQDNKGRTLSKEQQEFFKDSKIKNENGNLKVMYHGTKNGGFTIFDRNKAKTSGNFGTGIYFSSTMDYSNDYIDKSSNSKMYEVYLNITNPVDSVNKSRTLTNEQVKKLVETIANNEDYGIENYGYNATIDSVTNDLIQHNNDFEIFQDLDITCVGNFAELVELANKTIGTTFDGINTPLETVAFYPNQIKNIENTNPTTDDDIRYSQKAPTWQEHLEKNYKATGTRTYFDEITKANEKAIAPIAKEIKELSNTVNSLKKQIAPIAKENNTIAETKQNIAPVKKTTSDVEISSQQSKNANEQNEIARKTIKNKIEKAIQNQSNKAINTATKIGDSYIEFTRKEKASFKENLSKYIGMTREQLMNADTYNNIKDIVKQYADRTVNYTDNEMANVKKEIRKTKLKIDENLRNQIDDYGDFRKQNFGKLNLSNDGQSVDSFWQELSNQYPHYFSKNVQTEVDMLYQLSEFMNHDTTITEKYRIDDETLGEIAVKVYNGLLSNTFNTETIEEMQNNLDEKAQKRTRKIVQDELITEMGITQDDLNVAKDINQIAMQRTDPIRLNEKVFGYKIGQKINDATINRTKHNEAERIRFLKSERSDIQSLGIKARSKESAAVQKYAEKKYINEYGQEVQYGDNELMSEFSDIKTQEKIKRAAEMLRNKYDTYIDQINDVITNMGYDEIPKRSDYMRHFNELNDKLSKWGIPLNHESVNSENLPTDINGITDQFKPGKNWFASAMQRTGEKTTYDAITGIDGYLEGASNLIYHTEDIQRYRALSKMIRETFGQSKGFENLGGLTDSEVEQRIKDIQNNKLSNYVAWLDEQANSLAGKKGGIDRAAERLLGRKIYSILDTAKKQVGSNMTGFNVRSALTNFGSAVHGASKTNKLAFIKGTISTLQNIVHNDGLIDKSDFLTSRFVSNQLSLKLWQKASNAGQIFMTGSDYFTANQIWRSKYYENLSKGMSEKTAIRNADDFSARIMGDRSKGATAEIFNSKTLGLLTQFQLEVNNQWSSIVHDNKMDIKSGNKSGATVLFQLGQLATMSYFVNNFMKSLTGSDFMIDPIDLLKDILGVNDDDEEATIEQRTQKVLGKIFNNLPFVSFLTGGRIPVGEAFKGVETFVKYATGGKDSYGNKITLDDVKKDTIASGYYWLLPTGYGQLKKTTKGLSMYDKNLPVAGSYTDSGNLRFTADESAGGKIKAALFGQYSSKEADDYISSNYKTINANKIDEMKQLNMTSSEYRKYRQGLTDAGKTTDDNGYTKYIDNSNNTYWYDKENKIVYDNDYNTVNKSISSLTKANKKEQVFDYINSLDMSIAQKNKILNAEYGGETTDSYGNVKYTREEEVYNNGLKKYENTKGTTYWVNTKTGYVYNTSGKLAKNYGTLSPVKEEKTYWYDRENKKLYDSKYNTVDTNILSSLTKEKKVIDISDYNKYNSFDEYEYASNNPDKYAIIKQITSYDKYNQYNKKIKDIKDNSINDKNEVIKYVNSLNLSIPQKAMFIKTYYKSFKTYDKQIIEYIDNQKLSMTEKIKILTGLGFKMQNGIVVY